MKKEFLTFSYSFLVENLHVNRYVGFVWPQDPDAKKTLSYYMMVHQGFPKDWEHTFGMEGLVSHADPARSVTPLARTNYKTSYNKVFPAIYEESFEGFPLAAAYFEDGKPVNGPQGLHWIQFEIPGASREIKFQKVNDRGEVEKYNTEFMDRVALREGLMAEMGVNVEDILPRMSVEISRRPSVKLKHF